MKTKITFFIILCSGLVVLTNCNKTNDEPQTLRNSIETPSWTVDTDYDYASSMTIIVKVDLKSQFPSLASDFVLSDNDLVAAFSDDRCLGIATPDEGLFYLYITEPKAIANTTLSLKYWSSYYKNVFEAQNTIEFINDAKIGSVLAPFVPRWIIKM